MLHVSYTSMINWYDFMMEDIMECHSFAKESSCNCGVSFIAKISSFYVVLFFAYFPLVVPEKVALCFMFETWLDVYFLFCYLCLRWLQCLFWTSVLLPLSHKPRYGLLIWFGGIFFTSSKDGPWSHEIVGWTDILSSSVLMIHVFTVTVF